MKKIRFLTIVLLIPFSLQAQEDSSKTYRAPVIEVIGDDENALDKIPGSGQVINKKELETKKPLNLQEAVRKIPGVYVRQDDNIGLIPNIGIRGLDPDRSEKVLILEDGVPAGLAPYNENAAYYVPMIERFERVEVLKGSGSILHGPRTIGGVINLISPEPSKDLLLDFEGQGGTDKYFFGKARLSKTFGIVGTDLIVLHKRGDGFRQNSSFHVTEASGKLKFNISDMTKLTFKTNVHDQKSYQTYLGQTAAIFDNNPEINPAPNDTFTVFRIDTQTTLQHFFSDNIELLTNLYYSHSTRDWNRQDFARNNGFAAAPADTVQTLGNVGVDGGAIFLRSGFGSRDRTFDVFGIEPRLLINYKLFNKEHSLHTGMRFHYEDMLNERNNRASIDAVPTNRDRDSREVFAYSVFAQNTFNVTDKFSITPGIRLEAFKQSRHFERQNNVDVDLGASNTTIVPIPGIGMTYQLPKNLTLFTGFHRGFAPARTTEAIDSNGNDADLDPETSWNTELGIRGEPTKWISFEATFFHMHFNNQVIPAKESGGNSVPATNAGSTRHFGFEMASSLDILGLIKEDSGHHLYLDTKYTFVDAKNINGDDPNEGNSLPYAPKNTAVVGLRYEGEKGKTKGLSLGVEMLYTGSHFTDNENTIIETNDGTAGRIDDYTLMNFYSRYQIPNSKVELNFTANNITNQKYIASRAPAGIFPGAGFQALGGVKIKFD